MENKSVFNLNENIAAALAYSVTFFTGIVMLILERNNKFVRFHALQSTVYFGALAIVSRIALFIPFIGGLLQWALGVLCLVSYVYLIYTSYKGQTFKIPVLGDIAWEQVNK